MWGIKIYSLLHKTQTKNPGVEIDILLWVSGYRSDVVNTVGLYAHACLRSSKSSSPRWFLFQSLTEDHSTWQSSDGLVSGKSLDDFSYALFPSRFGLSIGHLSSKLFSFGITQGLESFRETFSN